MFASNKGQHPVVQISQPPYALYLAGAWPLFGGRIAHDCPRAGTHTIAWVDAASSKPAALGPGLARCDKLSPEHVRRGGDWLVSGAATFASLWSCFPHCAWLGRVVWWPMLLTFIETGYRGVPLVHRIRRAP